MDELAAVVLAGVLNSTPLPEPFFERQVHVPPIRRVVPRHRPPLDLNAAIFRYIIAADGSIVVNHAPAGARVTNEPECRSSRSSSAAGHRHPRRR